MDFGYNNQLQILMNWDVIYTVCFKSLLNNVRSEEHTSELQSR